MPSDTDRRAVLQCLGLAAGTVFALSGGILTATPLAAAATLKSKPLFVQISDTHIGFNKDANPDVVATLDRAIDLVNAMPTAPALVLHTGDITHLSRASEFDLAVQHLKRLKVSEIHYTPGEHDVTDAGGQEFFNRFGRPSGNKGWYSFDHDGVHFVCLVNVLQFKAGALAALGDEQLAWLKTDLQGRSASQPLVIFAHMPLWTIHAPWGWGTADGDQMIDLVRRFGSVTVLNGHIHQIVQKIEGHITFQTARSTAYPQPPAGDPAGPGPLKVPAEDLPRRLGVTSVRLAPLPTLTNATLA
jgi:hypothetical protein